MPVSSDKHRVRIEEVEWSGLLPFVHVFRSFRMAIHPPKLLTALLLATLLFVTGQVLDAIWGPVVYPGEIVEYATSSPHEFEGWLSTRDQEARKDLEARLYGLEAEGFDSASILNSPDPFSRAIGAINAHYAAVEEQEVRQAHDTARSPEERKVLREHIENIQQLRRSRIDAIEAIKPEGVFFTAMRFEVDAFERLMGGATALNLGLGELLRGKQHDPSSVVGALREMFVIAPGWLLAAHRWFLLLYASIGFLLWSLLGGAIVRMAALHASTDRRIGPTAAVGFVLSRWPWFILAPLIPGIVLLGVVLVLFLFGLVFFGIPGLHLALDIVGAIAFVIPIFLGLALALIIIGFAPASHLLYPAIAVEGCDGIDANSRAYSYVIARPWHLLFYNLIALIYGALTYLFVAGVLFLALLAAQSIVGAGADAFLGGAGGRRFEFLLPRPELGRLAYSPDWDTLNATGKVAATLIKVEVYLFIGLLAAYAISFYFCAQTWIYLLLRRAADGADFDDIFEPPASLSADLAASDGAFPDKIEPETGGESPEP